MNFSLNNVRCTVFVDKFISLGKFSEFMKKNLIENDISTILYQNIDPIMDVPITNWALLSNNQKILEVHDNKLDFYQYLKNEEKTCEFFLDLLHKILSEFKISVKRLAFAPTYIISKDNFSTFCEMNISNCKFKNSLVQNFSLSKVYYLNEYVDDTLFNMIYNVNVATQTSFFVPQERGQLIISIDINTKDTGNIIFSNKQVNLFYKNISEFNSEFMKNIGLGENKNE